MLGPPAAYRGAYHNAGILCKQYLRNLFAGANILNQTLSNPGAPRAMSLQVQSEFFLDRRALRVSLRTCTSAGDGKPGRTAVHLSR